MAHCRIPDRFLPIVGSLLIVYFTLRRSRRADTRLRPLVWLGTISVSACISSISS